MKQEWNGWLLFTLGFGLHLNTTIQFKKNCLATLQLGWNPILILGMRAKTHFKVGKVTTKVVSREMQNLLPRVLGNILLSRNQP